MGDVSSPAVRQSASSRRRQLHQRDRLRVVEEVRLQRYVLLA